MGLLICVKCPVMNCFPTSSKVPFKQGVPFKQWPCNDTSTYSRSWHYLHLYIWHMVLSRIHSKHSGEQLSVKHWETTIFMWIVLKLSFISTLANMSKKEFTWDCFLHEGIKIHNTYLALFPFPPFCFCHQPMKKLNKYRINMAGVL